jgi:hypothetical protein
MPHEVVACVCVCVCVQSGSVSLSLKRMLDCDQSQYIGRVQGEETDFETYCAKWRRTQAATITLTAINPSEASW